MERSAPRSRLARLLTVAVFLLAAMGMPGILPAQPAAAQDEALTVHDQSVETNFPDTLDFHISIESPEEIQQVELRYQPEFSEVAQAERPEMEPANSIDTTYQLDLRTTYLPPGINIDYRWVVTLADGQEVETESQRLFYIDNRYDWQETTEGPVSIYHYAGGRQFGELAMEVTTRTIDEFGGDFDVQLDDPINIVIYGSSAEFQEALPYNSPEWIGGFAEPSHNLIVAGVEPGEGAASEMGRMMTHEVVHLLVEQATLNPYNSAPRWLDEGLAINYQDYPEERYDRIIEQASEQGQLIPVRALRSSFPSDSDLAVQSYAQSESIVEFLIDEHGHESIASLLATYQEGVSHEEAVQQGLGMSLDELDAAWKDWLGYEGDRAEEPGAGPASPGFMRRVEDTLARFGVMPVLVIGGVIVMILGIARMARAISVRDQDEDVDPEVEYYGQPPLHESEAEDQHDPRQP